MQASGLREFIPFICTSAIWSQSCFSVHLKEWPNWQMAASCIPPTPQQSPWGVAASTGSQFWEPSFTFGDQKSMMAVTFLVYWYGRSYFHFTKRRWVKFCFFFFLNEAKRPVTNPLTSSGGNKEDLTKRSRSRKGENKRMISSRMTASSSLAVQWLRLSTSIARRVGSIPSRGT